MGGKIATKTSTGNQRLSTRVRSLASGPFPSSTPPATSRLVPMLVCVCFVFFYFFGVGEGVEWQSREWR